MESFAEPMNIEIINCWVITLQISECGINYGTSKCNDFSNTLIQLRTFQHKLKNLSSWLSLFQPPDCSLIFDDVPHPFVGPLL